MTKSKEPKTEEQNAEDWVKRTAKEHVRRGGNKGMTFVKPKGQNPVVEAFNEALKEERRRKVN